MVIRAGLDHTQVLQAAAELVDAEGPDGLTLGALAQRLGIKTPSLYNYVEGLPGLRRDLALMGTRKLAARLGRVAVGKSGDEAVAILAHAFRNFVQEHPGLYPLTVRSAELLAPADDELGAAQAEVVSIVLDVLSSCGLQGDEALHAVRGLRSLVHGFATLEASGGFGLPLELDASFAYLVQMFLGGLRRARG